MVGPPARAVHASLGPLEAHKTRLTFLFYFFIIFSFFNGENGKAKGSKLRMLPVGDIAVSPANQARCRATCYMHY